MSKGSERRPSAVSGDHYRTEHDRIFGKRATWPEWYKDTPAPLTPEEAERSRTLMAEASKRWLHGTD